MGDFTLQDLPEPWRGMLQQKGASLQGIRSFFGTLKNLDIETISDGGLLALLQNNGLQPLPLLGRKVAISGSARAHYELDAGGRLLLGLGDAVAEAMLLFGADVVINSHLPTVCPTRFSHLQGYSRKCEYVQADFSTEVGARNFVQDAAECLGGLDIMVLNAGTYSEPPIEDFEYASAKKIFDLNVAGPMAAVSEYTKKFGASAEKGRIILSSSINARQSETRHGLYDGSKGWLEAFMRSVSLDFAERGYDIRINAVAPGLHDTPLTHEAIHADPQTAKIVDGLIPLGIGNATSVVMPYVFLAMSANDYMNGTVIDVSGGLSACQMFPEGVISLFPHEE
jgi:NAD(P)-dependent dehydrogenase (short-subunit alcohol dehydrogenase family)